MTASAPAPRRLIMLGSTGSIGVSTLSVVDHLNRTGHGRFEVVGLAAGRSARTLIDQARWFNVQHLALADPSVKDRVQDALPEATIHVGEDASRKLVESVHATDLGAAVVGAAGLEATLAAIERGMTISLANKETLVAAGPLVQPTVERHGAQLMPVDSEHSAIFQCLAEHPVRSVKRVVLTASGGPFRGWSREAIENASVEEAMRHPTWDMGPKITVDSATMMNKTLEVIEAHWLFNLPAEKIQVIVHPQSIVHSFVEFTDGSILAQLGPPDMRTPIQYALTYPGRAPGCSQAMDWTRLSELTFEAPDLERFPALALGYKVIERGGTAGAVLNAANEAAVAAFLNRRIPFGRIEALARAALETLPARRVDSLEDVLAADREARQFVEQQMETAASGADSSR